MNSTPDLGHKYSSQFPSILHAENNYGYLFKMKKMNRT